MGAKQRIFIHFLSFSSSFFPFHYIPLRLPVCAALCAHAVGSYSHPYKAKKKARSNKTHTYMRAKGFQSRLYYACEGVAVQGHSSASDRQKTRIGIRDVYICQLYMEKDRDFGCWRRLNQSRSLIWHRNHRLVIRSAFYILGNRIIYQKWPVGGFNKVLVAHVKQPRAFIYIFERSYNGKS